jgi:hypothetical protein
MIRYPPNRGHASQSEPTTWSGTEPHEYIFLPGLVALTNRYGAAVSPAAAEFIVDAGGEQIDVAIVDVDHITTEGAASSRYR